MYPYNNQQFNIERLRRQKEEIESMINNFQNTPPNPVNNIINTQPIQSNPSTKLIEWRILNENEEVSNLYVQNKTLFVSDKNMILKDVDGKMEKWEIKKTYPIDPKDEKIEQLESKLKEMEDKINEYSKHSEPNDSIRKSDAISNGNVESKSKTTNK